MKTENYHRLMGIDVVVVIIEAGRQNDEEVCVCDAGASISKYGNCSSTTTINHLFMIVNAFISEISEMNAKSFCEWTISSLCCMFVGKQLQAIK